MTGFEKPCEWGSYLKTSVKPSLFAFRAHCGRSKRQEQRANQRRPSWKLWYKPFLTVVALAVHLPISAQRTINVPADFTTVQAGIDAASRGDTVLLAPGVYSEHIDFRGKAIVVSGQGPGATLDGGGANGAIVSFLSGESRDSVLDNVTVQNGAAIGYGDAGGIQIAHASPTIQNSVIQNNKGCGLGIYYGSPLLKDNTIVGNSGTYSLSCVQSNTTHGPLSGGIVIVEPGADGRQVEIVGNTISNNAVTFGGSGISIFDGGQVIIENNEIFSNTSTDKGAGLFVSGNTSPRIVQNLIYGNVINPILYFPAISDSGAGLNIDLGSGSLSNMPAVVVNNTIVGNKLLIVTGNGNDANEQGTQVYVHGLYTRVRFSNNLIIGTDKQAAIFCLAIFPNPVSPPTFDHNDVLNTGLGSSAYSGSCADHTGQDGNISADPQFATNVGSIHPFQLQISSPAIDTGSNSAMDILPDDFLGQPRIQDALGIPNAFIDMGAYEYPGIPCTIVLCPPPPPPVLPAFELEVSPASLALQTHHHGTVTVTVTQISGAIGSVKLACTNLPIYASCTFNSSSLNASGSSPRSTLLVIDTSVLHDFASASTQSSGRLAPFAFVAGLLPLCWLVISRDKRRKLGIFALLACVTFGVSSCSDRYPESTPPGSYTFTITGTSDATQTTESVRFDLIVKP